MRRRSTPRLGTAPAQLTAPGARSGSAADQLPGEDRADAFHESAAEIPLDPLGGGRRHGSPDGKRVVYGNDKGEIYVISMDGGLPQRIVDRGEDANAANWSPDGNLLVFSSARDPAHPELQFLDLQTGKRSVVPDSRDLTGGQWVAENTLVASPENSMKLEIFDLRTQQWSDLVPGKVPGSVGNWAHSPDYQYVYYTTGGAEPKAMRVRLADHKIENIADLKDLRRALGPDGNTQIGVAPDGSAIFTRDVGTQEI